MLSSDNQVRLPHPSLHPDIFFMRSCAMGRGKLVLVHLALLSFLVVTMTKAFAVGGPPSSLTSLHSRGTVSSSTTRIPLLYSTPDNQDEKLKSLGFSDRELQQSRSEGDAEPQRVKVQEVEVDPVTLTAIGFGLIAFNFLVLGNLGDGGISGLVASIINTLKQ